MDHMARYDRLQRIVAEAARYRTLREVVKSDPEITPHTVALLRRAFNVDNDETPPSSTNQLRRDHQMRPPVTRLQLLISKKAKYQAGYPSSGT
jgi:hypothetical protein